MSKVKRTKNCNSCYGSRSSYLCDDVYGLCLDCCCIDCGMLFNECKCNRQLFKNCYYKTEGCGIKNTCKQCSDYMNTDENIYLRKCYCAECYGKTKICKEYINNEVNDMKTLFYKKHICHFEGEYSGLCRIGNICNQCR